MSLNTIREKFFQLYDVEKLKEKTITGINSKIKNPELIAKYPILSTPEKLRYDFNAFFLHINVADSAPYFKVSYDIVEIEKDWELFSYHLIFEENGEIIGEETAIKFLKNWDE